MRPEAVGLPIHEAVELGLLREREMVLVEHVPSGRRLRAWVGWDGQVRTLQGWLHGCVTVAAGVVDGVRPPDGTP